ncbi:MAG TPA: DUF2180 family protein [bacterium]|nr:DUF2180 family protein [bacterium]
MRCWHCDTEARGVCALCGRALCKDHAKEHPNILAAYDETGDTPKVIMVDQALYCGVCKPVAEPIDMPELE